MAHKYTSANYICQQCGYTGRGKIALRGSAKVEWFLWLVLFIPGPFYSIWRRSGKDVQCAMCDDPHPTLLESKLGQLIMERQLKKKIGKSGSPTR